MAVDRTTDVLRLVCRRLDALLAAPDAWGSPESVELQVLLLLETRVVALGGEQTWADGVTDRYWQHLQSQGLGEAAGSLARRLGLADRASTRFVEVLRSFMMSESGFSQPSGLPPLPTQDLSGPVHMVV